MKHKRKRRIIFLIISTALVIGGELLARLYITVHVNPPSMTYTTVDGYRVTIGQPINVPHNLYMFGSSVVYGWGVRDSETIASRMQQLTLDFKVVNRGTSGSTSTTELSDLQNVNLSPGDIVVFYDGFTELTGVYYSAINKYRLNHPLCGRLQNLALVMVYCNWLSDNYAVSVASGDLQAALNTYRQNIYNAIRYTHEQGARFYHFIAPMLLSRNLNSIEQVQYEKLPSLPGLDQYVIDNWKYLKEANHRMSNTIDVSAIFDTERDKREIVFLDQWHTTARANAIIAEAIAARIVGF